MCWPGRRNALRRGRTKELDQKGGQYAIRSCSLNPNRHLSMKPGQAHRASAAKATVFVQKPLSSEDDRREELCSLGSVRCSSRSCGGMQEHCGNFKPATDTFRGQHVIDEPAEFVG